MKHNEQLPLDSFESASSHRQSVRSSLAIASLLLTGCSAVETSHSADVAPVIAEGSAEVTDSSTFNDLIVIIVDNPLDDISPESNIRTAARFEDAIEDISRTTDGFFDIPSDIPTISVTQAPTGIDKDTSTPCYSADALHAIRTEILQKENYDNNQLSSLVIASDSFQCDKKGLAGFADGPKADFAAGVYQFNALATGDSRAGPALVPHELGHMLNLSHVGSLGFGTEPISSRNGMRDISDLIRGGFKLAATYDETLHKDKIDYYASYTSVMGDSRAIQNDVYDYAQINQLNPLAAPMRQIDVTEDAFYTLEVSDQNNMDFLRGISIALPDDHPLRQMPGGGKLRTLSFGLNNQYGRESAELVAFVDEGEGPSNRSYNVETFTYIPASDYAADFTSDGGGKGRAIIYRDRELGIQISALATETGVAQGNSRVELHVEQITSN